MTILGYRFERNHLSPKDLRDWESEGYAHPYFGVGSWTFNNPKYSLAQKNNTFKSLKRTLEGREKGLYVHVWLFGHRFDLNFRKIVPV